MRHILATLTLALLAATAIAAPVTFDVRPTFTAPATGGPVSGYRAYQGCNLAAQTVGALIGPVTSGTVFSFAGDSASPPTICVRAWNSTGDGAFATVATLNATLAAPGSVSTTYTCTLNPVSGGTCTAN